MSFPERLEQLLPPFVDPFISAISLIEPGDDRDPRRSPWDRLLSLLG